MEHEFYREQYEAGADLKTLVRCLLSALKATEEQNERLKRKIESDKLNYGSAWYTTGQPSQHGGDWQ